MIHKMVSFLKKEHGWETPEATGNSLVGLIAVLVAALVVIGMIVYGITQGQQSQTTRLTTTYNCSSGSVTVNGHTMQC